MRCLLFMLVLLLAVTAQATETLSIAGDAYAAQPTGRPDAAAAAELLSRARQAAQAGEISSALRLATDALQLDPDEATCRRVLGYELVDGKWRTPFQKKQHTRGLVWDPRFGWLKPDELPRYEAGGRRNGRRWLTEEQDAARRTTIETGWQVRTDRWVVTTNHSLEAATNLAAELEAFFQLWRQLFGAYYLGEAELRGRFAGTRRARVRARPMRVVYHRDKQAYVAALRHRQPRIADTLGIYFDNVRESHFYHDPDADPTQRRATLYHEAAHQLFQELTRTRKNVGAEANYWLVEAVALYCESITPLDSGAAPALRFMVAGPDAGRLPAARRRLLGEAYYVPLAELSALGRLDLQRRPDLAALYSQAAGVAAYLMHQTQTRERLVAGLRRLYTGKTQPGDLPRWLGEPGFATLDAGYRRFLQRLPTETER